MGTSEIAGGRGDRCAENKYGNVAAAVLSRFHAAQTMNSVARRGTGVLFQGRENWVGFES